MLSPIARLAALIAVLCTFSTLRAEPLPSDPSLVTGQLDNGLKYVVKQHAIPPGRAVIWIHMHTGSLNESDRQRGLAHYLEHMAFNGSQNFRPGELVPFFESLGMQFGRDQNAFTNFDETTYQLTLPNTKPETLGKGFAFFSDVVGRLSLLPTEIDAERGIIQEERRRGLSGRQRTSFYILEHMAPGSLYGERITIGKEETIASVNQDDFKDYYGKFYGASNATLMVVADTDPAGVVSIIKEKFGDLPKRERPTRQDIRVKAYDKSFAIVASDPEIRSEDLQIVRLEPAHPPVTTVAQYRDDLVLRLATGALNRRLSDKVSAGGTSYRSIRISSGTDSNAVYTAEVSGRPNPGKWKETLSDMALELQRGRMFGFSPREIEHGKKEMISGAERAVETEPTTPASGFISRINGNVGSGEPTMSAAQRLELLKKILPTITDAECGERFAREFDPKAVCFIGTFPAGNDVPTEAQLLEMGLKALEVKPTQESEGDHATTLMTKLPAGGKVAEETEHAATKIWSSWLSNNTRVHYRFMDERKNNVSISIDLLGGELLESADNRGVTSAATLAWSRPATKALSSTDIRELMTGKKINVRGGGGFGGGGRGGRGGGGGGGSTDSISLNISGSPEELETGFQLAYLLLTEPKIEQSAFDQYVVGAKESLQESLQNPQRFGARAAASIMYPDDAPRVQPMTSEQIDKLTLGASQAWLDKLIKESPIEVVIVGDVPREQVMDLVAKYLGSLPSRDRVSATTYAAQRKLQRPKGARSFEKTIDTPTDQAFVMAGFYGCDQSNRPDARAMSMAARVLSMRMVKEVREEAQLVYSIGAGSRAATTYPGFGVFSAAAPTEPSKAPALVAKLREMYTTFAKGGPSEEEMTVARKQTANTFETSMEDPGYWSGRMQQLDFRGNSLDDILSEPDAYQTITGDQVRAAFAKYCTPDAQITVVVTPTAKKQ
jgi:zinc protease